MGFDPISKAMLMSAGLGTRLRPFTLNKTKALLPVLGVPISQYVIDSLVSCGVTLVVANIHHDAEKTREGFCSLDLGQGRLILSDESSLLLGSAGGIRKAIHHFGSEPFFLANADVLCDVDWSALARCHSRLRSQWGVSMTLGVLPCGPPGADYREILFDSREGLITGFGQICSGRPFYIGAAVLEPEAFSALGHEGPADFVESILRPSIQNRKAGVFLASGSWYDIGSPQLWLNTHLSMIHCLETGYFPSPVARLWKQRIEKLNHRVQERVWVSRGGARNFLAPPRTANWASPAYWDGRNISATHPCARSLGPHAVLYGAVPGRLDFGEGIGFGGDWVKCRSNEDLK